jgi:type IX secretion system PorP/SprF family membrane protein
MRKLILFLCLLPAVAFSQQVPQYTQFLFNHFGINPAVAGTHNCIDMRLGYRTQWVGFDGAPKTSFANLHARIPKGKKRGSIYRFHAVGLNVYSDGIGPVSKTHVSLAYALNLKAGKRHRMAFGVFAGFDQFRFNATKVTLATIPDDAITGSTANFILPDISPGFLYYTENKSAYISFTMDQLLKNKIKIFPDTRFTHHYILMAGKKWASRSSDLALTPSVAFKFAPWAPLALDVNVLFDYTSNVQFGASWRNTDALALMCKVSFLKYFSFGYAFDFTTSKIRLASSNTHEIILGISACPKQDYDPAACPVF